VPAGAIIINRDNSHADRSVQEDNMARVVGIDHLVIRVSDYQKSKSFYGRLFAFLGFQLSDEYEDAIGWTNGKTRFWIGPADTAGKKHKYRIGDVGFHHYAFELLSRKDVDELQAFLLELGATIVDPAGETTTTTTPCSSSIPTGSSSKA
jgi:catechol 2,3-dioxygenase-like lactoylglutathione lyase family enzyme